MEEARQREKRLELQIPIYELSGWLQFCVFCIEQLIPNELSCIHEF